MKKKKPSGIITSSIRYALWGWIPVLRYSLWFRSLDVMARRCLDSQVPNMRGMGRSIVRFMCEFIYWEITHKLKRGGWIANHHLNLIDYAVEVSIEAGDSDVNFMKQWKEDCYETIGFPGPNRVLVTATATVQTKRKRRKKEPFLITESVEA